VMITLIRRFVFGVAVAVRALLVASPSSAYLTQLDATSMIAPHCKTGEWKNPSPFPRVNR